MKTGKVIVRLELDTTQFKEQIDEARKNIEDFVAFCDEHGLNKNSRKALLMFKFRWIKEKFRKE